MKYIKGDYIVLLTTCVGVEDIWRSIPIGYVYKLTRNFDWFALCIEKNMNGNFDGWSISNSKENKISHGKMTVRAAALYEIEDYIRAGRPVKANQIRAYEIY